MKTIIAAFFLSCLLVTGASAQFLGPSKSGHIQTVETVQKGRRGQDVALKGFVVKHLRDSYYLFRDTTGEIRVRIDRPRWRGRTVTSKMQVRLTGKIDREVRELYVNVARVDVLK